MPELSRKRIIEEAIALADEEGISAVTFRAVADRLDAHFTSIRHYLSTKDELVDGIADALLREAWRLPAPDADWRQVLRSLGRGIRTVARRHPGAIAVLTQRAASGPAALDVVESCLAAFDRGGFTRKQSALAFAAFNSLVVGLTFQEVAAAAGGDEPEIDRDRYPHAARLADARAGGWDFAVDALIAGMDQSTS